MPRTAVLPAGTDPARFRLLNDWQRGFPLESRPFAVLGAQVGLDEEAVVAAYRNWLSSGVVSRIGAVFAPRRLGAGALVALAVPPARLTEIAARVSAEPGVNHNYEREHRFNLWFVMAAASAEELERTVAEIESATGCPAIVLPLLEEYHIDLGFDLAGVAPAGAARRAAPAPQSGPAPDARPLSAIEWSVLGALQEGLPLLAQPYAELCRTMGASEHTVFETIERALTDGLIRRFGVVVRHRELGIGANAMCVWDVPDEQVGAIGRRLATEPVITLCYRRPRALPHWRYNLFCMIHGSAREAVLAARDDIARRLDLDSWPHAVLFSGRRFKQVGSRYLPDSSSTNKPASLAR